MGSCPGTIQAAGIMDPAASTLAILEEEESND
jgi:hypothetical protein